MHCVHMHMPRHNGSMRGVAHCGIRRDRASDEARRAASDVRGSAIPQCTCMSTWGGIRGDCAPDEARRAEQDEHTSAISLCTSRGARVRPSASGAREGERRVGATAVHAHVRAGFGSGSGSGCESTGQGQGFRCGFASRMHAHALHAYAHAHALACGAVSAASLTAVFDEIVHPMKVVVPLPAMSTPPLFPPVMTRLMSLGAAP